MAACPTVTLRARYQGQWTQSKGNLSPRSLLVRMSKRNYIGKIHVRHCSESAETQDSETFLPINFYGNRYRMHNSLKYCCLQSLINSETAVSPNLILLADQALLAISIAFAYLAGVIPSGKTFPLARNSHAKQHPGAASSTDSGRPREFDASDSWNVVGMKLSEALEANVQNDSSDTGEVEFKNDRKNYPLSMLAVDGGPRLRLLLITLHHLRKEVSNISGACELVTMDRWLQVSTGLINGLVQPAFIKWLEEEQALENDKISEKLMKVINSKIKEDDRILKRFNRLGKAELYLDMLFFLRFGCVRSDSYFDAKFLREHGTKILEDLVIFLADGIASIYLELMSVDGDMSSEIGGSSLVLCSMSTRALQKLRNEVALNWWLHQYFESVVSMYEDRFELYIICRKEREKPAGNPSEKITWWRRAFGKAATPSAPNYVHITPFSLPVRRTKELRALTGWRYYFSLLLELSDIATPFARTVVTKIGGAVSYVWVSMIGRSLGLIFSGIRQSLGWR